MHLESLPKKLKKFEKFWTVKKTYVDILLSTDVNNSTIQYYNDKPLKSGGYYTVSSYEPNVNFNVVLEKDPSTWKLCSFQINVIDFDSSGEIGHYLFSLFEYFCIIQKTYKYSKQVYKTNLDSKLLKDQYERAKKDLFEVRNVINTCSKFSPVFEEIREYCMYLVNIGITSEDFKKKDFRTVI